MHVGILSHNFPPHPGGLEVMVMNLARGLAGLGHQVTLVSSAWEDARGVSVEHGVTVHRLPTLHHTEGFGVPYPVQFGPGWSAVRDALRSADVLNAHGALYVTSQVAAGMARKRGTPLVLTDHVGILEYEQRHLNVAQKLAWATLGRFVLQTAQAVTTYNGRVADFLRSQPPHHEPRFIGNGVDMKTFAPRDQEQRRAARGRFGIPPDDVVGLFVGRDTPKKNLPAVLNCARDGYSLAVCGADRALPEDVVNLGLQPYDAMPDLFGCVDFMVLASIGEGFPLAIQEAMATGLPVVVLWDEGYGAWVSREAMVVVDRLDQLPAAMQSMASDAARRQAVGAAALEWVHSRWSWEATVAQYEALFLSLID
ncbi:MAG: glycosyltransferase family 4 protein [Deltaproteobacteria bacterium]|nr:glycosyltransferase family 4 protein [Deltaproteobacteria bacterium]